MKKLFLLVLCLFLVAGFAQAAAGGNSANQDEQLRHAGKSSIYFYDIKATDTHGSAKLVIDTDKHTFVCIGQDFMPNQQVHLQYAGDGGSIVFAAGKTTPSGNLHIAGAWESGTVPAVVGITSLDQIYGFYLYNEGWFVAKIAVYYSTDEGVTWKESDHTSDIRNGVERLVALKDLGVPDGAYVKIHAIVVGGKDRTGSQVFQGYHDAASNLGYYCYAYYWIAGPTWNPDLEYEGGRCETTPMD